MIDEVQSVIEKWQSDERLTSLDEAKVQQVVVLPILRGLGWNPDNDREVDPQYRVEDGKVDYALLIGSAVKVFIEAKNGGESLEKQTHQEQLLRYSFKRGVRIAVLTNGATWWFYLPLQEGSWEQRKFYAVEFDKQSGAEIAQKFVTLLSKANVSSGKAVQTAEDLYKRHQIAEALPKAWNQLVDDTIAGLLTTRAEELCGHKPDENEVHQFLSKVRFPQITSHPSAPEPAPRPDSRPSGPVTGKKPTAFTFNGSKYEVTSWRGMLVRLCEVVHSAHRNRFEEVLSLRGKGGATYFSRDSNDFITPEQINETDIFVEINLGASSIRERAQALITHFGHDEGDLSYELRT